MAFDEAHEAVRRQRPNVVIISFNGDVGQAVRLGAELQADNPSMTLVAYADASDNERIKAAMRGGFREFVVLPDDSELLRRAVHDAAYAPVAADEDRGTVITICGTRGGSGCTGPRGEPRRRAAARFTASASSTRLSPWATSPRSSTLQPKRHIGDVLRELDRLDARVLAGSMAVHTSKMHVLAQPHEISERPQRGEGRRHPAPAPDLRRQLPVHPHRRRLPSRRGDVDVPLGLRSGVFGVYAGCALGEERLPPPAAL
ncbi:MAG: hypothetical protein IPI35_15270 [Deltaproteobacteria bacterium]|nr:hypothetical protein [Deltaproteobacteria bacterium]